MARTAPRGAPAPSSGSPPTSPALRFAEASRAIGHELSRIGLVTPVFRSPPRLPGRDRTVRRRPAGGVVVAVRLGDRPFAAVVADLIEGACVANRLERDTAESARARLWDAVERSGQLDPAERPRLRAA